jgi:hypothetical protein
MVGLYGKRIDSELQAILKEVVQHLFVVEVMSSRYKSTRDRSDSRTLSIIYTPRRVDHCFAEIGVTHLKKVTPTWSCQFDSYSAPSSMNDCT